jgi:hypothetical protein
MSEPQRVFEIDLIVRSHGQPDARVSREYVTSEKASTDGVAGVVFGAIHEDERANSEG